MPGGRRRVTQRSPLARPLGGWATVRARLDDTHYEIQMESRVAMPVLAFYSGARVLVQGERVLATWRDEGRLWHIQGVGKPIATSASYQPGVSADDQDWDPANPAEALGNGSVLETKDNGFASDLRSFFCRFPGVAVTQGSTIASATLAGTGGINDSSLVDADIYFNDIDDAVVPADGTAANALTRTTASLAWDTATGGDGVAFEFGDVTAIIQEIVDRGGWSSGNAMMMLCDVVDQGQVSKIKHVRSFSHATGPPITLSITTGPAAANNPTEQLRSTDLFDFEEE